MFSFVKFLYGFLTFNTKCLVTIRDLLLCIRHNLNGRTNKTKVNLINYENIGKKLLTIGKRFCHTALYAILSLKKFDTEYISKGKKEKDGTRPCKLRMYLDEILCV